ncbi:MAG: glycine-rich protein [Candidatus Cybelea sp.]
MPWTLCSRISARGASGADDYGTRLYAGLSGLIAATIVVTPGETLAISVGGSGRLASEGGFNGGGERGCNGSQCTGAGGGASDVRQGGNALTDRVIVAAGGGGFGFAPFRAAFGGAGGGHFCCIGRGHFTRGQTHGK